MDSQLILREYLYPVILPLSHSKLTMQSTEIYIPEWGKMESLLRRGFLFRMVLIHYTANVYRVGGHQQEKIPQQLVMPYKVYTITDTQKDITMGILQDRVQF